MIVCYRVQPMETQLTLEPVLGTDADIEQRQGDLVASISASEIARAQQLIDLNDWPCTALEYCAAALGWAIPLQDRAQPSMPCSDVVSCDRVELAYDSPTNDTHDLLQTDPDTHLFE